ncbi:MAG: amidohydrolase family protein [Candidatus Bipolaricaulota bacterium]|nr:amidohydrolase family protein [Candidatus Bipolaricaulota bacterium]
MDERIILGGVLLTAADAELRAGWGVRIVDGAIAEVGPNETLAGTRRGIETIDARDLLLMPGFVNAHMHSYGLLAHGIPLAQPPAGFYPFLAEFWWPRVEDRLDAAMIEAAFRLACARMIRSGVTTVCDILEAPHATPGVLDVEARVADETGIRAVLSLEASERHGAAAARAALFENAGFAATHGTGRVTGMMSLHTSFSCSEAFVREGKALAVESGVRIHLHLSESDYEPSFTLERYGVRPAIWYDRLGLWDSSVLASQGVALDADEIAVLAKRRVRLAHMPASNCEVGGGVAPVPEMLEAGMRPGLGTDGYINDPFEVMRAAFLIHKGVRRDARVMPARTVLAMATSWGADAVGVNAGVLAPGRRADLIGVRLDFDTPLTPENVADQLVLYRSGADVALTIVDGRVLFRGGELLTVDAEAARREAHAQAQRLWTKEER